MLLSFFRVVRVIRGSTHLFEWEWLRCVRIQRQKRRARDGKRSNVFHLALGVSTSREIYGCHGDCGAANPEGLTPGGDIGTGVMRGPVLVDGVVVAGNV